MPRHPTEFTAPRRIGRDPDYEFDARRPLPLPRNRYDHVGRIAKTADLPKPAFSFEIPAPIGATWNGYDLGGLQPDEVFLTPESLMDALTRSGFLTAPSDPRRRR